MKIEVRKGQLGLVTVSSDPIKHELFRYLFKQVYPSWNGVSWQCVPGNPTVGVLQPYDVDLNQMARMLRDQGWCAYYWRDRHGIDNVDDDILHINYGRRQGLVFGRYCPNLTAWLLTHV
jgi:hypothetical protein